MMVMLLLFSKSKELILKDKLVLASEKKYNDYYRVTLGLELINRIKFKLLMVMGSNKNEILKSGKLSYPINRIKNKYIVNH